jgi:UV DNA damage endonuclease
MTDYVPTNFNLGYACICTELREKNIFSSRTCKLSTLEKKGLDYIKELCIQNLKDLLTILKWNKENEIYFMRMSSEMFPFASHGEHGYDISFADDLLKEIGQYAKENKIRLTMHPGQYDVLSSSDDTIIFNTINDLEHHCDILDRMGLDQNSVMIIHGGGVYGNKKKAIMRIEENFKKLSKSAQDRLVLENCEMSYSVEDLLEISERLQIPIVLDFHHDEINPSTKPIDYYFERVFQVWKNRGIKPKVHVSNSVPGITKNDSKTKRRKHSDFIEFFHKPLLNIKFDIDVMLECKMKEQSIVKLRKVIKIDD